MAFNSYTYLVFLPVAVYVFWQLPKSWRPAYLLIVGAAYYTTWTSSFVILPLSLAVLVYVLSQLILAGSKPARAWLRIGIALVLLNLGFFKYRVFLLDFLSLAASSLGSSPFDVTSSLAAPVGISFYSFACIAYLIDTAQGRVGKPSFPSLSAFLYFWPNLIAGPIVRARELIPQLRFDKKFEFHFLVGGVDRFIWGLVQKNVFANSLAVWVDEGFQPGRTVSTLDAWFLAVAFGLQIYFDFSGYTYMAIGSAQLVGIKLPENFRFPYHASNPSDFWSRWHMTLTRWIRDYLFFPVNARFRGAPVPLYLSLIGIMSLVGLWHGAGWPFIIWGALHGLFMVCFRVFETYHQGREICPAAQKFWTIFWRAFTLVAVTGAWVAFRAHDVPQACTIWKSMFLTFSSGGGFAPRFYMATLLLVLLCAGEPYLVGRLQKVDAAQRERQFLPLPARITTRFLLYCGGLLLFMIFSQRGVQFIYSQF